MLNNEPVIPETTTATRLRAVYQAHRTLREEIATLRQYDADGQSYEVPLGSTWQPLPGRAGVQVYHIPNPDGTGGLYLMAFSVEPGASYAGSRIAESRLVELVSGELTCNGQQLRPGNAMWLAPHEATTWHTDPGALGVVRYDLPNPLPLTP